MTKKIVKVEDKKKNSKIDLDKIKDVIVDNKDTIAKIVDIADDFLDDNKKVKKNTNKSISKSSSKSTKSKENNSSNKSDLSSVIDIAKQILK